MTTVFYKDPSKKCWMLIAVNFSLEIARDYATKLREKGFEAFASNRSLRSHRRDVLKQYKFAQI